MSAGLDEPLAVRDNAAMARSGSSTRYDLKYHFVWVPKYRKRLLTRVRQAYLKYLLQRVAAEWDLAIVEMEVMEDHVHLFLEAPPRLSPAEVMNVVKGVTSREMFLKFPELRRDLWAGELWADGYYVASVGDKVTAEVVRRYIRNQTNHELPHDG
jgi:putative transposase